MHEFTGVDIDSAMAMSARPLKFVTDGDHEGIWFPERVLNKPHPKQYPLSIQSGAMATAERFHKH